MSVGHFNLGWLLAMLMLSQLLGHAQIRRAADSGLGDQTNTLSVVWNPSPSEGVTGYVLYWGLTPAACTNRLAVRNVTNVTLMGFKAKATYHFAVAAYDASGDESPWSNRIQYSIAPEASPSVTLTNQLRLLPVNSTGTNLLLRLSFVGQAGGNYQLQATEDFQHWDVLCVTNCAQRQRVIYEFPATGSCRFFRLRPQ